MGIKIKVNEEFCVSRFHPRYVAAQKYLDSEVLRTSAPFTPKRTGDLILSGNLGTEIGSGVIEYNASYAKRMYYGLSYNFSKDENPQACAQWFEKAKAANLDDWEKGVQKIIGG